jgi:hypothetical protein
MNNLVKMKCPQLSIYEDLAKFGYNVNMKVENIINHPSMF